MAMVNCKSGQVHSSSESTSAQESSEKPLSNEKELPTLQQIDPSIRLNKQR